MTVKEIVTRLNIGLTSLTQRQRDLVNAWMDTDIRVSRTSRDGKISRTYQTADVTRTELLRMLRDIMEHKSPPSVMHLFEGE